MKREEHKTFYTFVKIILRPIFTFYYRPKYINKEVIPEKGPIIVCGNHKHLFDQCLTIGSTKRMLHYMAKKEYFDSKKTAWFFKACGCISVNRQKKDEVAKNRAIGLLQNGYAVGIFPEGTRNRTKEKLLPLKFGAVSMAQKTDATIVPFAIRGDYKFRTNNLVIEYGKPFKVGDKSLAEANEKLTKELLRLLEKK